MKIQEIYIDANNGFGMAVYKVDNCERAKLVFYGEDLEVTIESNFNIIEEAIEQAEEDIDFYKPGLKGNQIENRCL